MIVHTIKQTWAENELKQNSYLVEFEHSCILIDAGCPVTSIKSLCDKPLEAVFVTHGHFDHIAFIEEYKSLQIPIYAHLETLDVMPDIMNNVSVIFNQPKSFSTDNITLVNGNELIEIDGHEIRCLHTPGHCIDSMSYLVDEEALFSGDTIFSVAVGRYDLPTSNVNDLMTSLKLLDSLKYDKLYAGHGRISDKKEQIKNINKWLNILNNELKK